MKKIAKATSLIMTGLAMFAFTTSLSSGFEGVVTYTMSIDSDNPQAAFMQGSSIKTYVKGSMSRTDVVSAMYKRTVINDGKKGDAPVVLVDFMGNKYQLKDDGTKKPKDDENPTITYIDSTKTIAGYSCKKAQCTVTDPKSGDKYTADIYYTDQLAYSGAQYKGLKGFPLYFTVKQMGMNMAMTATSVQKQSVPDSLFTVPPGYKLMTEDEMKKDMMQKSGGGGN